MGRGGGGGGLRQIGTYFCYISTSEVRRTAEANHINFGFHSDWVRNLVDEFPNDADPVPMRSDPIPTRSLEITSEADDV